MRYDDTIQKPEGEIRGGNLMAKTRKLTQSEIDGVQYRRAKLWQIILYSCNALCGLTVYSLIGQAS